MTMCDEEELIDVLSTERNGVKLGGAVIKVVVAHLVNVVELDDVDQLANQIEDLESLAKEAWDSQKSKPMPDFYAREIAKWIPDPIRSVVTLGSPFGDISRGTNVTRMLDWLRPNAPLHWDPGMVAALRKPPPRPSTAIYSRTDGVAHWRACCEPDTDHTENIEVPGSHCGLGFNALVFLAIADRLAQPEGTWEPFRRSGWETLLYG